MNAEELRYMISSAVKGYLDPSTIRQSENVESSGLRQSNAIREMFDQIRRFLDDDQYHEEALVQAEAFVNKKEFNPALHACLVKYWSNRDILDAAIAKKKALIAQGGKMAELTAAEEGGAGGEIGKDSPIELRHRIRALTLTAMCKFYLTLNHDSKMESKETFTIMMKEMENIVNAMKLAFEDDDENYHLVYNGTLYLYQCCQDIMKRGYFQQAALFLGWCVRSCDSVLKLCTTNFLQWRVRLYTTLAYCYEAKQEYQGAQQVAQWLQTKVDDLVELEMLDVVPPSEKQLTILNKAQDDSRVLLMKYQWCAGLAPPAGQDDHHHDHAAHPSGGKGGKGGKGGAKGGAGGAAHDDGHPHHPAAPAEMLDKIKQTLHPGLNHFTTTVTSLLSILSDATTRLASGTEGLQHGSVSTARLEMNKIAAEALWLHILHIVDDFNRRHNLDDPAWKNAESILDNATDAAAGGKKDTKKKEEPVKKGGKNAPVAPVREDTPHTGETPPPTTLEELLTPELLAHISRALYLYVSPNTFALEKISAVLSYQADGVDPTLRQEADLFSAMYKVQHSSLAQGREEACHILSENVLYLCRSSGAASGNGYSTYGGGAKQTSPTKSKKGTATTLAPPKPEMFYEKRPDLVEDAALLLLKSWNEFKYSHEKEGVSLVMEAACLALVKSNHQDTLKIASLAVTAGRFCGAQEDFDRGVRILTSVEQFLHDRQIHFVFTHNNDKRNVVDSQGEQVTLNGSVTLHDGLWLRTLRDFRSEIHRQLCALRLQRAINAEHDAMQSKHSERVVLMHQREAESHLYGRLSKKETRAMQTVEAEEVPRPHTIPATEQKLLAWSALQHDPVATALAHCEISLCQKAAADKRKSLEAALAALKEAAANRVKLRTALGLEDEDPIEATPAQGFSLYLGWSVFAHYCSRLHQYNLVSHAVQPLMNRFVDSSIEEHEVWNKSLCSWDALKKEQADRLSGELAQWLADGFAAIAEQQYLEAPYIPPTDLVDSKEDGLDKRRYTSIERERNSLRAANTYLHALELAVGSNDDPSTMRICSSLLNCILPVLAVESPSAMVVRPLFTILHAIRSFDDRRWSDGPLQLLAVRVFSAAMDVIRQFPETTQRSMSITLANIFCDIWALVLKHPNEQQKRHLMQTNKNIRFSKNVLQSEVVKVEAQAQPDPVPAAKGKGGKAAAGKGGKGGANDKNASSKGATGAAGAGDHDDPHYNSIFVPNDPMLTDLMPTEYLDAFDQVLFSLPHCIPVFESRMEQHQQQQQNNNSAAGGATTSSSSSTANLFPQSSIAVAAALQQSPQAAVAKLAEYINDLQYVKLCGKLSGMLIKKRQYDIAHHVCLDGIKESKNRHTAISMMENDAIRVLQEAHAAEIQALASKVKETGQALTLKDKASMKLSHRLGMWRRRTVYRKMRLVQRQYDLPWHATLELNLSIVHFHFAQTGTTPDASHAAGVPAGTSPAPAAKGGDSSKKASAPKSSGKADPKSGSKAATVAPDADKSKEGDKGAEVDEDAQRIAEALGAGTRSIILFHRCSKSRFMFWSLQHLVNMARVLLADSPPAVLTDFSGGKITEVSSLGTTSRGTTSSTPILQSGPSGSSKKTIDRILHVESNMKLVCFQVLHFLSEMEAGNLNPRTENDSLQPVAIRSGEDCAMDNGILHRTTTLHMWLSPEGQDVFQAKLADENQFRNRLDAVFAREQIDMIKKEELARIDIERDCAAEFAELTDQVEQHEEENLTTVRTEVVGRKPRRVKIDAKLTQQAGSEGIPFATQLGHDISFPELVRCFMYAVQCLQYSRRKPTAIQLCLELNERLRNSFAVDILPFAINVQNATSVSTDGAMVLFDRAFKEQMRTQKLMQAAQQTWRSYKSTETFKSILSRLQSTLLPTYGSHHGDPNATTNPANPSATPMNTALDAQSVKAPGSIRAASIAGGSIKAGSVASSNRAGGGSMYREVVSSYGTAIAYLRQKHSTEYLVHLLNELGMIHLMHRVKSEAERAWCDCADAAVGQVSSLGHWRTIFMEKFKKSDAASSSPSDAAQQIGLWKGLNAVCALGGLAMFVYNENQAKSVEACLFAAEILWQFNRTSLASPQRFWDENRNQLREALAGVTLEADSELMPVLTHRMFFIASHLIKYNCPRQATTVARTLEYCARYVLRNATLVTHARCLLAHAAALLGDFNAALNHCASVSWGRDLPDLAFGHQNLTYDIIDDANRLHSAPPQDGKAGKGAKDKGKAGKNNAAHDTTADHSSPTDMFAIEFDNALPLCDEINLRALEHFISNALNSNGTGLIDAVTTEYGPFLSRYCVVTFSEVLLILGGSDPLLSWAITDPTSSAADGSPAGGKGAAKGDKSKGGAKGGAAGDEAKPEGANACAVALQAAEKLIQGVQTMTAASRQQNLNRPKSGDHLPTKPGARPTGSAKGGKAAGANTLAATTSSTAAHSNSQQQESPEDHFVHQVARFLSALLNKHRGFIAKSTEILEEILEAQKSYDKVPSPSAHVLTVTNEPSFTYSVDIRFVSQVHAVLADCYSGLKRWDATNRICTQGIDLASQVIDVVSKQELLRRSVVASLRKGDLSAAITSLNELESGSRKTEWQGSLDTFANALGFHNLLSHDIDQLPHLQRADALTHFFNDTKQEQRLGLAEMILLERTEGMGLNLPVYKDKERVALHNKSASLLQQVMNEHAIVLIRQEDLAEAHMTLREALKVSAQSDTTRYPLVTAQTRYLLAVTLRLLSSHGGKVPISVTNVNGSLQAAGGNSPTKSTPEKEIVLDATSPGTARVPTAITELVPSQDERHSLLQEAVAGATAAHDFELLRRCFAEWALLYMDSNGKKATTEQGITTLPNAEVAAFSILRQASQVAMMQHSTFDDTSIYYDSPLSPGIEESLPLIIQDELEDYSRREFHSQDHFSTTMDKLNQKPPAKPAPTLALLISYFTSLQTELKTADPAEFRQVEAKLLKVAQFLSSRLSALPSSAEQKPPVFEKPFVFGSPSSAASSGTMKANSILHQNYLAAPSGRPQLVDENGITKLILPQVTMLFCLFPHSNDVTVLTEENTATTSGAAAGGKTGRTDGGKGAAGAKSDPKKDAAAAEAATAQPGAESKNYPDGEPKPILSAFTVDQGRMKKLASQAKYLSSTLAKQVETHPIEEKVEGGSKDGGGKGGKGDKKDAAGAKGGKGAIEIEAKIATPAVSARADEATRKLDELRSEFLVGLLELIIASRYNGQIPANAIVEKESKAIFPAFTLVQHHYALLSELLDPAAGGVRDCVQDADLCHWLAAICRQVAQPLVAQ